MAYEALWHEYMQMPVVTRAYTTACVITTLAVVFIPHRLFSFVRSWQLHLTFLLWHARLRMCLSHARLSCHLVVDLCRTPWFKVDRIAYISFCLTLLNDTFAFCSSLNTIRFSNSRCVSAIGLGISLSAVFQSHSYCRTVSGKRHTREYANYYVKCTILEFALLRKKVYCQLQIVILHAYEYATPVLILILWQTCFQIWRLITTFLFFGNVGFNLLFNMIFTYRYCRMLEEGSFRRRTADFVMMFIFGGLCMIVSLTKHWYWFLCSLSPQRIIVFKKKPIFLNCLCRLVHFLSICSSWGTHSQ